MKKKSLISNFVKIRPVGAELLHTDGRTDMTKLTVAFRNFVKAPKNGSRRRVEKNNEEYNREKEPKE